MAPYRLATSDGGSHQVLAHGVPYQQNISHVTATDGGRVFAGVHLHSDLSKNEKPIHELLPTAVQAPFDASSKQDDPLCLEDTRVEVLKEIRAWTYGQEESCIFWLNGMAGTGKSTIARTAAREFSDKGQLGASFFFTRGGGDVAHAGMFFTSIASQLAIARPEVTAAIREAVRKQPDIASKSRNDQWTKLIAQPLAEGRTEPSHAVLVMVVDGLDECDDDNDMKGLVTVLAQASAVPGVRLRILITSRPETPIRLGFKKMKEALHRDLLLHAVPREVVDADICIFFYSQFEEIKEVQSLPEDWPGVETINQLVQLSAGLFIFAATVCHFVDENNISAEDSLELVLTNGEQDRALPSNKDNEALGETTKFLDVMYRQVLDRSAPVTAQRVAQRDQSRPVREILGVIAALKEPLPVGSMASLLSVRESDINQWLSRLHSVVRVPAMTASPIHLFHASFRDFLFDRTRCNNHHFLVDKREVHGRVLQRCIEAMESTLRRNICRIDHPGVRADEVGQAVVDANIPPHVQYACQYWVQHFQEASVSSTGVARFLEKHLLHWLEAMALMGKTKEATYMLATIQDIPTVDGDLSKFLHDARRFLLAGRVGIKQAPLQTYGSALLFAPTSSITRLHFSDQLPKGISRAGEFEQEYDTCMQHLHRKGLGDVLSVALSPDGTTIASGWRFGILSLWDTMSGASVQELNCGSHAVMAVAFSRDGKMVASASLDNVVLLWDAVSGSIIYELVVEVAAQEFTWQEAMAVAFSPDGRTVASASLDGTVWLWDTTSGSVVHELTGHDGYVSAVAFSPDAKTIASASYDWTVRLWDVTSGHHLHELKGHTGSVYAVAFSLDGKTVASASCDMTTRLWDASYGSESDVQDVPHPHGRKLEAAAFSSDAQVVVFAFDTTIQLWDTTSKSRAYKPIKDVKGFHTVAFSLDKKAFVSTSFDSVRLHVWDETSRSSENVADRVAHQGSVRMVAFSPDGKSVASASTDRTVRLWNATTGHSVRELVGHCESVTAVAFSADGKTIASASASTWEEGQVESPSRDTCEDRNAVRLWVAASGQCSHVLIGHSAGVWAIAFSPDGKMVASGSHDNTVRLWETTSKTGSCVRELVGDSPVASVTFAPDGETVASGSGWPGPDYSVRLWNVADGSSIRKLVGQDLPVTWLAFLPHGKTLISASTRLVCLWNTTSGALLAAIPNTGGLVTELSMPLSDSSLQIKRAVCPVFAPGSPLPLSESSSPRVALDGEWLYLDTRPLLWMPPSPQMCCSAVHANTIVIGHRNGRVRFLAVHDGVE